MKISTIFGKVFGGVISTAITLAILFFGGIALAALILKQDYVTTMNAAFATIGNLFKK